MKRIKQTANLAMRKETLVIAYILCDLMDDGVVNGSVLNLL